MNISVESFTTPIDPTEIATPVPKSFGSGGGGGSGGPVTFNLGGVTLQHASGVPLVLPAGGSSVVLNGLATYSGGKTLLATINLYGFFYNPPAGTMEKNAGRLSGTLNIVADFGNGNILNLPMPGEGLQGGALQAVFNSVAGVNTPFSLTLTNNLVWATEDMGVWLGDISHQHGLSGNTMPAAPASPHSHGLAGATNMWVSPAPEFLQFAIQGGITNTPIALSVGASLLTIMEI